jgi:hypothetical protein
MRCLPLILVSSMLAAGCCPGPFCEGGTGMCGGLAGRYVLHVDENHGDCGAVPTRAPLTVSDVPGGYALDAPWVRGCVLRETAVESCEYQARCDVVAGGISRSASLRVTRNGSGFYGTAELVPSASCMLRISTGAP